MFTKLVTVAAFFLALGNAGYVPGPVLYPLEGEYKYQIWLPGTKLYAPPDSVHKAILNIQMRNIWKGWTTDVNGEEVQMIFVWDQSNMKMGGSWIKNFDEDGKGYGPMFLHFHPSRIHGKWTYGDESPDWGYCDFTYVGPAELPPMEPKNGTYVKLEEPAPEPSPADAYFASL